MPKNKKNTALKSSYKMIPVHPSVHTDVAAIADANHRTLGGQVAHWASEECDHPAGQREVFEVVYSMPGSLGQNKPLRGYFCKACKQFVVTQSA
jgi:hypothetical protein